MNKAVRLALVAGLALSLPMQAKAGTIVGGVDALKEWNLIVLGNVSSSSEVEGRTFIGGDLSGNSSNYTIGSSAGVPVPPAVAGVNAPGLTVVGNVSGGTKNLNNGSGATVGGNVSSGFNLNGPNQTVLVGGSISNTNVNSNTVKTGQSAVDGFIQGLTDQKSVLGSSLTKLSKTFSNLGTTDTASFANNTATFNVGTHGTKLSVFDITASQLAAANQIQFNLNSADTVIVNVSGSDINLHQNFLGNSNNLGQNVIWNFEDANTFTSNVAWHGSVLAPTAAATTYNYIQGSAVFASLIQNGEVHLNTYAGSFTPGAAPEPTSWALMIVGFGAVGAALRRRRTARAGQLAAA